MRFTKLSAFALVALSLISTDTLASPVNRKFHPVVNDDPQNAHLNVQTPGADINQTVVIQEEPGFDGQVIPVGETKVASCVVKDANGDIDLSAEGSCAPSKTSAPVAEHASVAASTMSHALPSSSRMRTVRVPSLPLAPVARAVPASKAAPSRAVEAARVAAPAHRTESAHVAAASLPVKQLAPAAQAGAGPYGMTSMQWLEIAVAAAMLFALGLRAYPSHGPGRSSPHAPRAPYGRRGAGWASLCHCSGPAPIAVIVLGSAGRQRSRRRTQ